MKILITGAHFTTAQAVVEELQSRFQCQIVYIGRKHTLEGDKAVSRESQEIPEMGVKFYGLITGRLQRSFSKYTIPSLIKIPIGFFQSMYILIKEKPDVVVSFGGYVSVPVVVSSWLLSIPVLVHEQTLVSGLANTICGWFADRIAISFKDGGYGFNSSKVVYTGNPMRKGILGVSRVHKELEEFFKKGSKKIILVLGGNQGSHFLNQVVGESLSELIREYKVIIQTGDSKFKDFEKLEDEIEKKGYKNSVMIRRWFDEAEMGWMLKNVDFVICRGGINTLTELAYFNTPGIVVPVPYIYKNEQEVNGRFFEDLGLVKVVKQKDFTKRGLLDSVKDVSKALGVKKEDNQRAKSVVVKDAAARIAQESMLLYR